MPDNPGSTEQKENMNKAVKTKTWMHKQSESGTAVVFAAMIDLIHWHKKTLGLTLSASLNTHKLWWDTSAWALFPRTIKLFSLSLRSFFWIVIVDLLEIYTSNLLGTLFKVPGCSSPYSDFMLVLYIQLQGEHITCLLTWTCSPQRLW